MRTRESFISDVLVIGGATAGCFAAIHARMAGASVLVADKASSGYSGSSIMACGFWSCYNPEWGHDLEETMAYNNRNSCYLNNRDWSELLLRESWETVEDLLRFGVELPCGKAEMKDYFIGQLRDSVEAAGGGPIHAEFEHVGTKGFGQCPTGFRKINPQLRKYAESIGVRFVDRVMITDLVISDGACTGATGFYIDRQESCVFRAKATLISAGKNTFKGPGMGVCMQTGDATAMASRAGAVMTGGEFPDMHTTLALHPYWKSNGGEYATYQLYTRSEGDGVIPWRGFDLGMVSAFHDGQGPVYWDLSQATTGDKAIWDQNQKRRNAPHECGRAGLDMHKGGRYNVAGGACAGAPAEQSYGVWLTDFGCKSSVPGLWAAGDAACTWAWGAILDGPPPGLMPAGVTGKLAGIDMGEYVKDIPLPEHDGAVLESLECRMFEPLERTGGFTTDYVTGELQHLMMPYYILHIKSAERLEAALKLLEFQQSHFAPRVYAKDMHDLRLAHEYKNMLCNAKLMLTSSLERRESRGWHYREDFPGQSDEELSWITMRAGKDGGTSVERVPVPDKWLPDISRSEDELYAKMWLAWEHK